MTRPSRAGSRSFPRTRRAAKPRSSCPSSRSLYPNEALVRTALRGAAAYQLSWFDAHLWAYAEHYGLDELWSEDFQHDRLYGTVRVVNPFV